MSIDQYKHLSQCILRPTHCSKWTMNKYINVDTVLLKVLLLYCRRTFCLKQKKIYHRIVPSFVHIIIPLHGSFQHPSERLYNICARKKAPTLQCTSRPLNSTKGLPGGYCFTNHCAAWWQLHKYRPTAVSNQISRVWLHLNYDIKHINFNNSCMHSSFRTSYANTSKSSNISKLVYYIFKYCSKIYPQWYALNALKILFCVGIWLFLTFAWVISPCIFQTY